MNPLYGYFGTHLPGLPGECGRTAFLARFLGIFKSNRELEIIERSRHPEWPVVGQFIITHLHTRRGFLSPPRNINNNAEILIYAPCLPFSRIID